MPQNCSADVSLVIDYVDGVLLNGTAVEKQALKEKFGLGDIEHDADFARYVKSQCFSPVPCHRGKRKKKREWGNIKSEKKY